MVSGDYKLDNELDMNIKNEGIQTKVLRIYEIRIEENSIGSDSPVVMHSVYSEDGGYVGSLEDVNVYFKLGILPEKSHQDHKVCSIGKSLTDGKWYGWSHRAIYGFSIGDVVKEGDLTASSGWTDEYLKEHPEEDRSLPVGFKAETEEDAKRMAIAFADSVS